MIHVYAVSFGAPDIGKLLHIFPSSVPTVRGACLNRCQEVGQSPRPINVRSAQAHGETSETFGAGTISAVAGLPSSFTIVPRYRFISAPGRMLMMYSYCCRRMCKPSSSYPTSVLFYCLQGWVAEASRV